MFVVVIKILHISYRFQIYMYVYIKEMKEKTWFRRCTEASMAQKKKSVLTLFVNWKKIGTMIQNIIRS